VLKPNYRGSTNYGEAHKWGIVNDYFKKGYEDIMTGVDHLIAQTASSIPSKHGGTRLERRGSLVQLDPRQHQPLQGDFVGRWHGELDLDVRAERYAGCAHANYLGGNRLPYDDFEPYWKQSPIRYIRNAKTPTMIHVVDGDPRVPRPQSEELYMALRKLGVPTEYFVYPGATHGIPDPAQPTPEVGGGEGVDGQVDPRNWRVPLGRGPQDPGGVAAGDESGHQLLTRSVPGGAKR
jgi:hypothetical protein